MELKHVLIVFRHGDRSPITSSYGALSTTESERAYWISKFPSESELGAGGSNTKIVGPTCDTLPHAPPRGGGVYPHGLLTVKGVEMMKEKGKLLRKTYAAFIDQCSLEEMDMRSTNLHRTIQSLQFLLQGMFPEYHAEDQKETFNVRTCPHGSMEPDLKGIDDIDLASIVEKYKGIDHEKLEALRYHFSHLPADGRISWTSVREIVVCKHAHALEMPQDVLDAMEQILQYNYFEWQMFFTDRVTHKSSFQKGIQEIAAKLESVASGEKATKLSLYSAHDTTLAAVCAPLGIDLKSIPPYAASFAIELWQDSSENLFVQCQYQCEPIYIPGYDKKRLCTYEEFKTILEPYLNA